MNTPSCSCGCCEGVEKLTPMSLANRPGLSALSYRAGTYSAFFESMVARLSNLDVPTGEFDANGDAVVLRPLVGLTTREPSDPAIALLDAWALCADVLTFYDERIANEGYLHTATERRSVLELARLIGYALRPGVASTAYLAYTIDEDRSVTPPKGMEVTIPAGSRAQSVPEQNQLPQTFETAEPLRARTVWNKLQPRMSRPQTPQSITANGLWLKGTATNLKPNDPLLVAGLESQELKPMRVLEVTPDTVADKTHITLRGWRDASEVVAAVVALATLHQTTVPDGSAGTGAVKNTLPLLKKLADHAPDFTAKPAALLRALDDSILPRLVGIYEALPGNAKKVEPWLRTIVKELQSARSDLRMSADKPAAVAKTQTSIDFFASLKKGPSNPPPNASQLNRNLDTAFKTGGDIFPRLFTTFQPRLGNLLGLALANATVAKPAEIRVYALRVSASLFAHNAPEQPHFNEDGEVDRFEYPQLNNTWGEELAPLSNPTPSLPVIALDAEYEQLKPGSFMLIERPGFKIKTPQIGVGATTITTAPPPASTMPALTQHTVTGVETRTMSAYGVSAKAKLTGILPSWFSDVNDSEVIGAALTDTPMLRGTRVYTQSELLPLAEAPMTEPVCEGEIELDGFYDGLAAGRWVIISGKRADVLDVQGQQVAGIDSAELAMILSVSHRVSLVPGADNTLVPLPDDKTHTFVQLSIQPNYCYVRDKMSIYGNVVKATHGETRREVLGSGDASKSMQSFTLRQAPLTFLPAPTPAGAASTLVLRVNEVEWHETDTLATLLPDDRKFISKIDDESKTTVVFGNGRKGARPPTGRENITAVYRNGIGEPGNCKAGQISQLGTRPLGVKEVVNPLPATGGADREGRDQARKNAPLGVLALDRLVSVQDYADFTRTFAGIGKASAVKLSDRARELVHVTIAGANDVPIDPISDLYRSLVRALRDLGDPYLPIQVELREMLSLIISANVRVLPDYAWEFVEPKVRAAVLEAFSFERRDLAQDVTKSEVISVIQGVRGVAYVDLDCLCAVSEKIVEEELALALTTVNAGGDQTATTRTDFFSSLQAASVEHRVVVKPARVDPPILPAQIAALWPELPETLVLIEAKA